MVKNINLDEGRVIVEAPHPPALLLKEKGAKSYTFYTFVFYQQNATRTTTISPLRNPLLEERAG
jgi:hypothetical protein